MRKIIKIFAMLVALALASCGTPDRFKTKNLSIYNTDGSYLCPTLDIVTTWERLDEDTWRRCSCGDYWLIPSSSVKIESRGTGYKVTEYEGSLINIYE